MVRVFRRNAATCSVLQFCDNCITKNVTRGSFLSPPLPMCVFSAVCLTLEVFKTSLELCAFGIAIRCRRVTTRSESFLPLMTDGSMMELT